MKMLTVLFLLAPVAVAQTTTPPHVPDGSVVTLPRLDTPPPIRVDSVSGTFAMHPGEIVVRGANLDRALAVTIGDKPATIVAATPDSLRLRVREGGHPGFWQVVVQGRRSLATSMVEYWPTLEVRNLEGFTPDDVVDPVPVTDVTPQVGLRLHNGAPGDYLLLASLDLREFPATLLDPPTGFALYVANPLVAIGVGSFPENGELTLRFRWPLELMGQTIYVQSWCSRVFERGETYCFSNVDMLTM